MRNATKVNVAAVGAIAALAFFEHGIGEILQGNVAPDGLMILSWPLTGAFGVLGGEPAMTIIPSFLLTGMLAMLFSLVFLVWATMFAQRKNGGLVLIFLSIVLLLFGGGIFPPVLGIILGVVATGINAPLTWWRAHLSDGPRRFLGKVWPWALAADLAAWLLLFPGMILLDHFVGVSNPASTLGIIALAAFVFLLLAILTGFVRDSQRQLDARPSPVAVGSLNPKNI